MVDQLLQGIENRYAQVQRARADGRRCSRRPMPPRNTELASEQRRASFAQQVMAPGDRRAQRPLPVRRVPAAADQQTQRILQPREDRLRRQHLDPRGRQFDRQRQPLESLHDSRDRRAFSSSMAKPGTRAAARAANSCADSHAATDASRRAPVPPAGTRSGGHRELLLARQVQRRPACDEDPQLGAVSQ